MPFEMTERQVSEVTVLDLTGKLTIDQGARTSVTATNPVVISNTAVTDDAEITMDVDASGTSAKGLKVWILGHK